MNKLFSTFYRSKDGCYDFKFEFVHCGSHYDVICHVHPPLNGRDSSVHNTHLFSNNRICFVGGQEPKTLQKAMHLASMWAEYFLEYRRTGVPQS